MKTFEQELQAALDDEKTTPEDVYRLLLNQYSPEELEVDHCVLNEAAALITNPKLRDAAWRFYRVLAEDAGRQECELRTRLTIGLFEIIAEPPCFPDDVEMLFTLLDSEKTRWAVFAAYEHYPRTFQRHIAEHGRGRISPEEFTTWLASQSLEFTPRGLRFMRPR
ncbi:MAG: hypothetical protein ACYC67_06385 [Prosthecobacter sp.]